MLLNPVCYKSVSCICFDIDELADNNAVFFPVEVLNRILLRDVIYHSINTSIVLK